MSGFIIDVEGLALTGADLNLLKDEKIQGLILFSRNYQDRTQLQTLIQEIRAARGKQFLISVDHEGGRVQRFREGFSAIPPMATFAQQDALTQEQKLQDAYLMGYLMAYELRVLDIDLSYAPVLDIWGESTVIGNRSFSSDPQEVARYAKRFIVGMRDAGMRCVGKHYPGHGSVLADSHIDIPVDERSEKTIRELDMRAFVSLLPQLDAVMPAHVIYPKVDHRPAGFSRVWLQDILRQELHYQGVIISDDLSMQGAHVVGDIHERVHAAFAAGGQLLLICNDRELAKEAIEAAVVPSYSQVAIAGLLGQPVRYSQETIDLALIRLSYYEKQL